MCLFWKLYKWYQSYSYSQLNAKINAHPWMQQLIRMRQDSRVDEVPENVHAKMSTKSYRALKKKYKRIHRKRMLLLDKEIQETKEAIAINMLVNDLV